MSQNFSSMFKSLKNFTAVGIVMLALVGCGEGTSTSSSTSSPSSPTNNTGNTSPSTTNNSAPGTVVSRIEKSGAIDYKIYLQPDANGSNRKGIVLLGSGNNEVALEGPSVGSLDGGLENNTANELAKQGYVVAIVAYRK